jgi:hypothetical protein
MEFGVNQRVFTEETSTGIKVLFKNSENFSVFDDESKISESDLDSSSNLKILNKPRMVQAFHSNFLFDLQETDTNLPEAYEVTLKETSEIFANEVLLIENGKIEKVEDCCKNFALALKETIFNNKVVLFDLLKTVKGIYCDYHSEKQTIIAELLISELKSLETTLEMPKVKKKLFGSLDLESVKSSFISKYFTLDSIDLEDLFEDFKKSFKPFIKKNNFSIKIFENFAVISKQSLHQLYLKYFQLLNKEAADLWENSMYKMISIKITQFSKPFKNFLEFTLVKLIMNDCQVKISSITRLSNEKTLIILIIDKSSYLIICQKSKSSIIKVFEYKKLISAEGSSESSLFLYNKTTNLASLYFFDDSNLMFHSEFDIKLAENEKITSILYLSGPCEKIFFTSTLNSLSQVIDRNPRISINLKTKSSEGQFKLTLFENGKIICLTSNKKIRLFNEFLVLLFEVDVEFQVIGFLFDPEMPLQVVGIENDQFWILSTTLICENRKGMNDEEEKRGSLIEFESIRNYTGKASIDDYFLCNFTNYHKVFRREYLADFY